MSLALTTASSMRSATVPNGHGAQKLGRYRAGADLVLGCYETAHSQRVIAVVVTGREKAQKSNKTAGVLSFHMTNAGTTR